MAVIRVIGVGNADRGDDAAGLEVVRRLRGAHGIEARECRADPAALLEAWSGAAHVVIVDAMVSGRPPGAVQRIEAAGTPLPAGRLRGSTHGLGVAEAVELARALGRLPERLVVCGIEGVEFGVGAPLTPAVAAAVAKLAGELAAEPAAG